MRSRIKKEKRILNKFLRENKCKRKFYKNFGKWKYVDYNGFPDIIENIFFTEVILYAFSWRTSPEGEYFWSEINQRWVSYLKNGFSNEEIYKNIKRL